MFIDLPRPTTAWSLLSTPLSWT